MTAPTAAERVARGAQLLDRERPGWAYKIDLARLDLADDCHCVIGQLWGGKAADYPWSAGTSALGLDKVRQQAHGFETDPGLAYEGRMAAYAELTALWIAEIRRRTGGAA